jgi:hypothetical protein
MFASCSAAGMEYFYAMAKQADYIVAHNALSSIVNGSATALLRH